MKASIIDQMRPLQEEFNKNWEKQKNIIIKEKMNKPFKKLLGNRVYLNMPVIPESILILSDDIKKSLMAEEAIKWQKLTVFAKGELVSTVEEGDVVLVPPEVLARALVVPLSKEQSVILVNNLDICMIW